MGEKGKTHNRKHSKRKLYFSYLKKKNLFICLRSTHKYSLYNHLNHSQDNETWQPYKKKKKKNETNPAVLEKGLPLIKQTTKSNKPHHGKLRSFNVKSRSISFTCFRLTRTDEENQDIKKCGFGSPEANPLWGIEILR